MTYACIAMGDIKPESSEKGLMVNIKSGLLRRYSLKKNFCIIMIRNTNLPILSFTNLTVFQYLIKRKQMFRGLDLVHIKNFRVNVYGLKNFCSVMLVTNLYYQETFKTCPNTQIAPSAGGRRLL